jgi:hypothetical protein
VENNVPKVWATSAIKKNYLQFIIAQSSHPAFHRTHISKELSQHFLVTSLDYGTGQSWLTVSAVFLNAAASSSDMLKASLSFFLETVGTSRFQNSQFRFAIMYVGILDGYGGYQCPPTGVTLSAAIKRYLLCILIMRCRLARLHMQSGHLIRGNWGLIRCRRSVWRSAAFIFNSWFVFFQKKLNDIIESLQTWLQRVKRSFFSHTRLHVLSVVVYSGNNIAFSSRSKFFKINLSL